MSALASASSTSAGLRAACPDARPGYVQCFTLCKPAGALAAYGSKRVGLIPR
jgi:hypothetical protein